MVWFMNGIVFLALAVIFSSGVLMTMKVANTLKINLWQFLAVNYMVCSAVLLAWGAWNGLGFHLPVLWGLGVFVGIMYVLSLWLFNKAITVAGLALSTILMRLSAAIPTLGSLIIFSENATWYQVMGIVLTFLCLPLAGREPRPSERGLREVWKGMIWGLLLFTVYGVTDFAFKVQAELAPTADPKAFMAIIFSTSLILTLPRLLKGSRPDNACLIWGFVLGAVNMLATYFWIRTLAHLPGSVVYPTLGLGVIALTTLASLFIWREKLRPANYAFLALSCVAILLINLG